MLSRVMFSLRFFIVHRFGIKRIVTSESFDHLWDITLREIEERCVSVIILDFDGVLAPDGYYSPVKKAEDWLSGLSMEARNIKFFVLSNKPMKEREDYFSFKFPNLKFVKGVRKKPYPDGINSIIDAEGVSRSQVLIVDDRLMTGILAAEIANINSIFIQKPLIDFHGNFFNELAFFLLRKIDAILLSCLCHFR